MYYKGKEVKRSLKGGSDFQGYGDAVRSELSKRIPANRKLTVLDIGTGFGNNLVFLVGAIRHIQQIWSIDPWMDSLINAKKILKKEKVDAQVKLVRGAAENLPFRQHSFDLVFSVMMFHHLQQLPQTFKEISSVLKVGGSFLGVDFTPRAHILPFSSLHKKEDFFTAKYVEEKVSKVHLTPEVVESEMWYLVEAKKESEFS